jgi:hypothetical protein
LSSAELSLDISHVVKRLLAGDFVDVSRSGEDLAGKYPNLQMSGELIAKAIARTASMMGVVLEGWGSTSAARSANPARGLDASDRGEIEDAVAELKGATERAQHPASQRASEAAEEFASDISDLMDSPTSGGNLTGPNPVDAVGVGFLGP